jgi:hypothetical protein
VRIRQEEQVGQEPIGLPDYLIGESDYLRARLSASIDETSALERHAIAATGLLWAWIGANAETAAAELCWLPLLLSAFLGLRALAVLGRIRSIRGYLSQLERAAHLPQGLGWMASLEAAGGRWRTVTAFVFWSGINVVNLSLAIWAPRTLTFLQR